MTDLQEHLETVECKVKEATAKASPVICGLARAGYAAKGITYVLMGALAMLAAFSYASGRTGGSTTIILSLLDHSWGWGVLTLIAIGLLGYAVWCLVLAVADPERKGRDWKGLRKRFVYLCKGVVHLGLTGIVVGAIVGVVQSRRNDPIEQWTAKLMSLPQGIWLAAAVGACVIGAGVFQLHRSWRTKTLDDQLRVWHLPKEIGKTLLATGRFGVAARGVILVLVGAFMVVAAYHADPHEAKGVGRALQFIQHQTQGRYLLALVSLGLVCYGVFQFVLARYRRIDPT